MGARHRPAAGTVCRRARKELFSIVPFVDSVSPWIDQRTITTSFAAEQTLTSDTVPRGRPRGGVDTGDVGRASADYTATATFWESAIPPLLTAFFCGRERHTNPSTMK